MLTYELNLKSSTMKLQDHKIISIKFLLWFHVMHTCQINNSKISNPRGVCHAIFYADNNFLLTKIDI